MPILSAAELAELRAKFPITDQAIYVDHAAVGPISRAVAAAVAEQAALQSETLTGARGIFEARYAAARAASARLVGTRADRIAFVQNTSHGLSLIANGQPWRPGDTVLVPAMEFPSNYLPWLRLERLGVELRRLHAPDGRITPDVVAAEIDERTKVIALSAVQYHNGYRVDLAGIAEVARQHGAMLVVDGTQAVGAMHLDVAALGVDALVVSAHKWMLGPLGIGFMALSERMMASTEVTQLGWLSVNAPFDFRREIDLPDRADRFEPGTENAAGLFGLQARLAEIEAFGARDIETRVLSLAWDLAERLARQGFAITSPDGAAERSGIVTFRHDALASEDTVAALRDRGIYMSARHGNLRASPHYYTSEADIAEIAEALSRLLP
jgi:cysteine desulfurase/selenocysteine lyase